MKVLNRPMFRIGGPIKEGIMDGIKEPRQRYQDAGQVFKNVQANLQAGQVADPKVLNAAAQLGIGNPYKDYREFKPYMRRVVTKPTDLNMVGTTAAQDDFSELSSDFATTVKDPESGQIIMQEPQGLSLEAQANLNLISATEYARLKKAQQDSAKGKGRVFEGDEALIVGDPRELEKDTPINKVIADKGKIEDTPPPTKKERVNTILESLGYDRAQKNALYDAMIKAGQRISRTGLGAENLVSDVIAETSQSYDKPEKLREAAELMSTQQDLKLEQIEAGKTNATEESVRFLMSEQGGGKSRTEALDIVLKNPTTDDEAYDKAYAQNKDSGRAVIAAVNYAVERDQYDKPLGIIDIKKYGNDPKKFFEDKSVYKGPGNYILGGSVIKIDEQGNATTIKKYYTSKKNEGFLAKFGFGGD